jgi:hypothetical protein
MPPKTPLLLYGTVWKEDTTAKLTETALENGFTGVDTVNYPTAYNEPLIGDGIAAALGAGFKHSDLFVGNTIGLFFFLVSRLSFCMARYTLTSGATDPKQVYAGLGPREGQNPAQP